MVIAAAEILGFTYPAHLLTSFFLHRAGIAIV
jgi:hypothetical protein